MILQYFMYLILKLFSVAEMVLWSPDGKYYLTYAKEINVYSVEVSFAT